MREIDSTISNIAVVGGGRWGVIICSVLRQILPEHSGIWLVSQHLPENSVHGARRVLTLDDLPNPEGKGAALIATAPQDHSRTAQRLLSAGWHVLIEKPPALTLRDALAIAETAAHARRLAWVGLVYLFAPYLSVMTRAAGEAKRWRLDWCEPEEETRWGEIKVTARHVNVIEDVFPHAWSILRAAGLAAPLQLRDVTITEPWNVQLHLSAGEADIEVLFDRRAGFRRRYIRAETSDHVYELDFSDEPGTFRIDGALGADPPWNSTNRPLAAEIAAFLRACSGQTVTDAPVALSRNLEATALMENATKQCLDLLARKVAEAMAEQSVNGGAVTALCDAICREAAIAGIRIARNSREDKTLELAARSFIGGRSDAFAEMPETLAAIAHRSPFLSRVRKDREMMPSRPR